MPWPGRVRATRDVGFVTGQDTTRSWVWAPRCKLLAQRHTEPSPNNPRDRRHPAKEPDCKENREAAEKIKALPWHCTRQVGKLGWCRSTAPDAPPTPEHEGPMQDGEIRDARGQQEGTLPRATRAHGSSRYLGTEPRMLSKDAAVTSVLCEVEWSSPSPVSPGDNAVPGCLVRCQPLWVPQLLHHPHLSLNARSIQKMEKSAQRPQSMPMGSQRLSVVPEPWPRGSNSFS